MELGYGLITNQRYPGDARSAEDLYREALETARLCESAGLDSVWTSEHHFWDDDYMPSLLVLSAAMAAITERIKIATGVLLAPLYHPIRLAEDSATVALISGGRFILGMGIGWRAEEFDRLGIPIDGAGRRLSETVKILRLAWGPDAFTFEGKTFRFERTNATPKPTQPIPIWIGGFQDPALRRAGRIGDAYFASAPALDDLERRKKLVLEGIEKSGRDPSRFRWGVHEPMWVCDDPEKELGEILPHIHYSRWKYRDMGAEFGRGAGLPEAPPMDDETRAGLVSALIIGTPAEVAKKIEPFREILGSDLHLVARSSYPGVPFDKTRRSIELLGELKKLL